MPKEHRGLYIFVTKYRPSSGVWWTRIQKLLKQWIHKASIGGVADHECIETAFDAQLSMEQAMLDRTERSQINTDYDQFLDTFDPPFFHKLLLAIGLPQVAADLLLVMYTMIQRRMEIGKHVGKIFSSNRGFGQGDSMSLFAAPAITTIPFRFASYECPKVQLGSGIDDRNFRGHCSEVIRSVHYAIQFDDDAELTNNLSIFLTY